MTFILQVPVLPWALHLKQQNNVTLAQSGMRGRTALMRIRFVKKGTGKQLKVKVSFSDRAIWQVANSEFYAQLYIPLTFS